MQPLDSTIRGGSEEAPATGCIHRWRAQPYQFRRYVSDPSWVMCAILYRPVVRRAVYMMLIVGMILTILDQGDVLLTGAITSLVVTKILLTYTVPYSVSTFSALWANRVKEP